MVEMQLVFSDPSQFLDYENTYSGSMPFLAHK